MGGILVIECKCWNVMFGLLQVCGLWFVVCGLWFVVCGLWFVVCGRVLKFGSGISLSEESWFRNLIILKSFFSNFKSVWIGSHQSYTPK